MDGGLSRCLATRLCSHRSFDRYSSRCLSLPHRTLFDSGEKVVSTHKKTIRPWRIVFLITYFTRTEVIVTGESGRSFAPTGVVAILSTTSCPETTSPKMV